MSKYIRAMLCVLLTICVFSGCKNKLHNKDNGSADSATNSANTENTFEENRLLSVLYNEEPFVDEGGRSVYMKDYSLSEVAPVCVVPDKYTFIDFDRDEKNELVAHIHPDFGGYLVLRLCEGTVYGYEFGERSMITLKADGTFAQSEGAGLNVSVSMTFKQTAYTLTELAYQNETSSEKEYRINGNSATKKDYQSFYKEFSSKPDAKWIAVDNTLWQKNADAVSGEYSIVYKTGEDFAIYTNQSKGPMYYYIVRDKKGVVMDRGYQDDYGDFGLEYRNGLLVLSYGYGDDSFDNRYYDVAGSRKSKFFFSPVAESDRLVAYFTQEEDQFKLIVQDIFDATVFYQEIIRDFSDSVVKQNYTGEFIENNTKLRVTYPVKDCKEPVTEEIPLHQ